MVDPPDPYMMHRKFLAALRDSLMREVLMRGHTTEYSSLSELTETAACIEDAVHYDIGTRPLEQTGGSYAAHARPAPQRAWAIEQHWPQPTGTQPRETGGRSPLVAQAKPSVQRGGLAHPTANSQSRPTGQQPARDAGLPRTGPTCYGCGQPGHIQPNCPTRRDKQPMNRVAAAAHMDEATADDAPEEPPEAEIQEDENPPADVERDEIPLDGIEYPDDVARALVEEASHYKWDTSDDGEDIPLYKAYKVDAPETGRLKLTRVGVARYITPPARGPVHKHHVDTRLCAGVKAEGNPPLYDYRAQK